MSMSVTQTRIQRLLDERVSAAKLHEGILAQAESRDDKNLSATGCGPSRSTPSSGS
jgi:hypothetical protein